MNIELNTKVYIYLQLKLKKGCRYVKTDIPQMFLSV